MTVTLKSAARGKTPAKGTNEAPATPAPAALDMVSIRPEELIVGRALQTDIVSDSGHLLLAAGTQVTPRFFDLLKQHNVTTLQIHKTDAERATLRGLTAESSPVGMPFDTELTRKLDTLIEGGSLFVANAGPAVRESMVMHGCKAYDPEQRESLIQQHRATGESLDNMMREAMHGRSIDMSQIAGISAVYLTQMTNDRDSVLTIAGEAGRDEQLSAHCLQMSLIGMALGIQMGLDERNVRNIGLCGLVHDWGMAKVPLEIRTAARQLTRSEFYEIQKHSIYSLELLEKISGIPNLVPLVAYQLHESYNGEGYPRGRRGNSIHLFARILKVADAYAALTAPRPWRPRLMPYSAMELIIRKSEKKHYDPAVVRALLQIISLFPIGSLCALNDGSLVRVLRSNGANYTSPVVKVLQGASGTPVDSADLDSLIDLSVSDLKILQALPEPSREEISCTPEVLDLVRE